METILRVVVWCMCILTALVCQARFAEAQNNNYGAPVHCLFSRIDEFNCLPRYPKTTRMPTANFFGNYTTRMTRGNSGHPRCLIRRPGHSVKPIPVFGGDERVKFIFSPGIRLSSPQEYGNQQYVLYNVSCPPGNLAFFNLTMVDLERPNCKRRRRATRQLCRDYVRISRPGYGSTEVCGNKPTQDTMNQLEERDISILFRTSESNQFPGFQATVICFKREEADPPGCTRPGGTDMSPSDSGRRRRDLDEFHRTWKKQLRRLSRRRRQAELPQVRFEQFNIPFGVEVFYTDGTLSFIIEEEIPFRDSFEDIAYLSTFDANGTVMFFDQGAPNSIFRGPGPMFVVGVYAYFQLFAIDPRGIFPNPEEMVAIGNLTEAQYSLVTEDNSTRLSEADSNPECADPLKDLDLRPIPGLTPSPNCVRGRRRKRQANNGEISALLEDSVILTAIENENACNPVLRTSATATIALVQSENPDRLQELRDSLSTTAPPTMVTRGP